MLTLHHQPTLRIAVLSPHRDDAAFSCALLMDLLLQAGADVTIVNVFTESAYAPYASVPSIQAVTQLRLEEDEALLQLLGPHCHLHDLHQRDAPLRLHIDADQVLDSSEAEADTVHLAELLKSLPPFDLYLLPLAVGGHIDHRTSHLAATRALPVAQVAYYEDLPYASRTSLDARDEDERRIAATLPSNLRAFTIHAPEGAQFKARCASCYPSQIPPDLVTRMSNYCAALNHGERYIMPDPVHDLLTRYLPASALASRP